MIELIVEPRVVKTWTAFCRENPSHSIALDGYVKGPTKYDASSPKLNLNHHEGVDELSTLSTSAQVWFRLKMGFFDRFKKNNELKANVYVNDPDQDVSLAVKLLRDFYKISETEKEELLEELVELENRYDISAGMYPFNKKFSPESEIMQKMAWIFMPYTATRFTGEISNMGSERMKEVIDKIGERIDLYLEGKSKKSQLMMEYEHLYEGKKWNMILEKGEHARTKLFLDNIKSFISVRKKVGFEGTYIYSVFNICPYTGLVPERFYDELNKLEGISHSDLDRWGGGDFKGGSPREKGSRIPYKILAKKIDSLIKD